MLLDEREKLAKLFIDNLLRGSISVTGEKYIVEDLQDLYDNISTVSYLNSIEDLTPEQRKELRKALHSVSHYYIEGKVRGTLIGKLYDEDLETDNKKLKERVQELELKNSELWQNNIALANELEDQKNIISSYEQGSYKRK